MVLTTKPHFQSEKEGIVPEGDNYLIKPRGLSIVWGNDERYWKIPTQTTSPTVDAAAAAAAELVQVSWLEVTGSVGLKNGKYKLTFDVELTPDAFGWKDIHAFLMAKVGKKGRYTWRKIKVQPPNQESRKFKIPEDSQELSIEVKEAEADKTLYFGLYEVWSGKWKGGLKIYNARVTASGSHTSTSMEITRHS